MNRVLWMAVFILGAGVFAWIEWRGGEGSAMGWFIETSVWSAVCGIGFTVCEWLGGARGSSRGGPDRDGRG